VRPSRTNRARQPAAWRRRNTTRRCCSGARRHRFERIEQRAFPESEGGDPDQGRRALVGSDRRVLLVRSPFERTRMYWAEGAVRTRRTQSDRTFGGSVVLNDIRDNAHDSQPLAGILPGRRQTDTLADGGRARPVSTRKLLVHDRHGRVRRPVRVIEFAAVLCRGCRTPQRIGRGHVSGVRHGGSDGVHATRDDNREHAPARRRARIRSGCG